MIIEVFYCIPSESNTIKSVNIESGTSIHVFLRDILGYEIETPVGVYGKLVKKTYIIRDKDRIEIYEKITANPKINRKKRAAHDKF
tara:strand:- start:1461 stop:1718 length:258 start_codon:yes stop_codon:yes gene_type:complete